MKLFDHEGTEQNEAWLSARFGAVIVRSSTAESAFRAIELRESIGPAVYIVKVLDENERPMKDEIVARHWPDPELPLIPDSEWHERGVYGPTNENGDIGFGSGGGDYYDPHGPPDGELGRQGASSFWVLEYPSDCVEGIGVLAETQHAHLDMTFQWMEGDEPPPPPPPPSPSECSFDSVAFLAAMETAIAGLHEAMSIVAESHT